MTKFGKLVLAGTVAVVASAAGVSAQMMNKAVDDRIALMKSNGAALGAITAFVKEGKGTAADVEMRLDTMAANSSKIAALFPAKTSQMELGNKATGAKPDIWAKWDDFNKAASNMGAEAKKFQMVVKSGDKAAIATAFGTFGRNACGTCHTPFRGKRET